MKRLGRKRSENAPPRTQDIKDSLRIKFIIKIGIRSSIVTESVRPGSVGTKIRFF